MSKAEADSKQTKVDDDDDEPDEWYVSHGISRHLTCPD